MVFEQGSVNYSVNFEDDYIPSMKNKYHSRSTSRHTKWGKDVLEGGFPRVQAQSPNHSRKGRRYYLTLAQHKETKESNHNLGPYSRYNLFNR
jgi:hypothetical protein